MTDPRPDGDPLYITRGLLTALLELAAEHEPMGFDADLGITPAGDFESELGVDPQTPIFTHFYLPDAGASVSAVFGFDLGIGPGQAKGRFIAHPSGELAVQTTDDLHARMLIAIPPWEPDAVSAFDRAGRHVPWTIVEADPPEPGL